MKRNWIYLVSLLIATLLFGCAPSEPPPEAWRNVPPVGTSLADAPILPDSDYFTVLEAHQAEAVAKLEEQSALLLSESEARHFAGETYVTPLDKQPYLVRSLSKCCLGNTSLRWDGESLSVEGMAMGRPSYTRTAIVVYLEKVPQAVYVTLSFVQ